MNLHCKTILACLAALAGLLQLDAGAQTLQRLRVGTIPIIDVAPLMVARQQGFFAQEGLQIETTATGGGAVGIPAMIGGALDITFGNVVSTMLAASQNLDVRVVAPATQLTDGPTVPVLVGRRGDAFHSAADFVGKTIGVNTRNGVNWLYARAWVKARGGDPDAVTYREVPFPQLADAIKRRQIDAGVVGEPFKSAFLKDPALAAVGSPFVEVQPGLDVGQYVTTAAFAAQQPETIARFVRGLRKGIAWYNANLASPELAALIADYTRLPLATVKDLQLSPLPAAVSLVQIQRTVELMQANGMLAAPLNAGPFVLAAAWGE